MFQQIAEVEEAPDGTFVVKTVDGKLMGRFESRQQAFDRHRQLENIGEAIEDGSQSRGGDMRMSDHDN